VLGDARTTLAALDTALTGWTATPGWLASAQGLATEWWDYIDQVQSVASPTPSGLPSYAQVIGVINELAEPADYAVAAAGGFPGELNKMWRTDRSGTFDCEYGFSCMGYEIGGAWGAAMASTHEAGEEDRRRNVISFCGDGSYMMLSPDVFSSVLTGHKMIVVLCDNGGYAVIQRLQEFKGSAPFNNRYDEGTLRAVEIEPDYAAHAAAMGAIVEQAADLDQLGAAFQRARLADRTTVIVIRTDPSTWTEGDAWWDVGVPEVSDRQEVRVARAAHEAERKHQRRGV